MVNTPEDIADRIAHGGPVVSDRAGGFMVRCPAHDDGRPSLHISPGIDQPVLIKCFAGCHRDDILAAARLTLDDIAKPLDPRPSAANLTRWGPAVAVYTYADEQGQTLFEVLRTAGKEFPCRIKDPSVRGGYRWSMTGVRRVLYRLPEVLGAVKAGEEVWIAEGEKDALALCARGVCGTTAPGGSGPSVWRPEYAEGLRGATVTVVADKDDAGQAHARRVRASLVAVDARVRIVEAHPDADKDASDHFAAGHSINNFVVTVPYDHDSRSRPSQDVNSYLARTFPPRRYVIENTLARGEVLGITGFEGHGKSTLLKQMALMIACGVHPFTQRPMGARSVLFIDCENDEQDNVEDFRHLMRVAEANRVMDDKAPLFIIDSGPIDLATEADRSWLQERVQGRQPDVLIIGPIYNMIGREISGEDDARIIKDALDTVRMVNGCAIIWEHHVPHEQAGSRSVRPIGSSLLMRWPSFGFGLQPTDVKGIYNWKAWRGGRRRSRHWPERLTYGSGPNDWPWVEAQPE